MIGSVTFNPGDITKTVIVTINSDALDEFNETLSLRLTGGTNVDISPANGTATVTILDDDAPPVLTITNASVVERDTGSQALTFNVTLNSASGKPITLTYNLTDVTTAFGVDYQGPATGTITFAAGETTKTITVLVNGDIIDEANETFTITLTPADATTIDASSVLTATGTIIDNDTTTISINDVSVVEGNAGTTAMTFNVTLSTPSSQTVTVVFNMVTGGTAIVGSDYTAVNGVVVTFAPGETSKPVTVLVNGDTRFEANETLNVALSNATGATILDGAGVGTILNDDARPTVTVTPIAQTVGEAGPNVAFTITLSNATDETVTVDYATVAMTATAGADFTATTGTLTFLPTGSLTQTVTVTLT